MDRFLPAAILAVLAAGPAVLGCASAGGAAPGGSSQVSAQQASPAQASSQKAPAFEVDPRWPKPLPNNWILGQVAGIAVDARDHVWIVQRPKSLTEDERGATLSPPVSKCCVPAPPVIELDAEGNFVQAWGGPGQGYDWPSNEHGIHVDPDGNVWLAGNGDEDGQVLKFSRDGKFLAQIGRPGPQAGSADVTRLGRPAMVEVDPETREVFVADGYYNRRVIVFDQKGAYRRHWGAYGQPPSDAEKVTLSRPAPPPSPPPRQFGNPVHCVHLSRDGLAYVCDRLNDRIQVFRKDGTFVKEFVVEPLTAANGSTWDLVLSKDREQRWLHVADGRNNQVLTLLRDTGEVVSTLGRPGRQAGDFHWVHDIAVDSKGNLYTGEVDTGKRAQKFVRR
jgi:DNA-binding beta-propeller fold protein YncE